MKLFLTLFSVLMFLPLSSLQADRSGDKVWMIIRPLQCLGNPWEKEWLAKNRQQADKFPRKKEFVLMKDYFRRKKIPVIELRVKPYAGEPLCQACDCPRGDTVYLLMPANHVPHMVKLGYLDRVPASDVPLK